MSTQSILRQEVPAEPEEPHEPSQLSEAEEHVDAVLRSVYGERLETDSLSAQIAAAARIVLLERYQAGSGAL